MQLQSAEELLFTLRNRLDSPIRPELKRRIVEILVDSIEADTVSDGASSRARSSSPTASASLTSLLL